MEVIKDELMLCRITRRTDQRVHNNENEGRAYSFIPRAEWFYRIRQSS
jgi:hypothetical protein